MEKIKIDTSKASSFVPAKDYSTAFNESLKGFKLLFDKMGKGKEFLSERNRI